MNKFHALLLVIAVACTNALAETTKEKIPSPKQTTQTVKQKIWESEPNSILGIKLGVPLSESMEECTKERYGYGYTSGKMCWTKGAFSSLYEIRNYPTIGVGIWDVIVRLVEGNVEAVDFSFNHSVYLNMVQLLKAKYGEPSQETTVMVQNRMGATFASVKMFWIGKNLILSFASREGKIDEGLVSLYSMKFLESLKFDAGQHKDKL